MIVGGVPLLLKPSGVAIPDDYITFYTMDSITGSTLEDETGSHDAAITGASQVSGYIGNALSFDGVNDFAGPPPAAMPSGDMTASFWIYIPAGAKSGSQLVLSQTMSGNTASVRGFIVSDTEFRFFDRNTAESVFIVAASRPADENYYNIVIRREGSEMEMFIDGVSQGTTTITGTPATSWESVRIGCRANKSSGSTVEDLFFEGDVDQMRIYDYSVPDSEVTALAGE